MKLIDQRDITISLIAEQLKATKFFNSLRALGLDGSPLQPHLDDIILNSMGLNDDSNETYDYYFHLIDTHSQRIGTTDDTVLKEAMAVYTSLKQRAENKPG